MEGVRQTFIGRSLKIIREDYYFIAFIYCCLLSIVQRCFIELDHDICWSWSRRKWRQSESEKWIKQIIKADRQRERTMSVIRSLGLKSGVQFLNLPDNLFLYHALIWSGRSDYEILLRQGNGCNTVRIVFIIPNEASTTVKSNNRPIS